MEDQVPYQVDGQPITDQPQILQGIDVSTPKEVYPPYVPVPENNYFYRVQEDEAGKHDSAARQSLRSAKHAAGESIAFSLPGIACSYFAIEGIAQADVAQSTATSLFGIVFLARAAIAAKDAWDSQREAKVARTKAETVRSTSPYALQRASAYRS